MALNVKNQMCYSLSTKLNQIFLLSPEQKSLLYVYVYT